MISVKIIDTGVTNIFTLFCILILVNLILN
jgi:hypothetical protein